MVVLPFTNNQDDATLNLYTAVATAEVDPTGNFTW